MAGVAVLDQAAVRDFWAFFAAKAEAIAFEAVGPSRGAQGAVFQTLSARLGKFADGLSLECVPAMGGGVELIVTANGVLRHFETARELLASAPRVHGWKYRALRAARPFPAAVASEGIEIPVDRLRFHAETVLSRVGVMLLASDVPLRDYVVCRNLSCRLVMDVLGEEIYGQLVTDVQIMDHADWDKLADVPESRPLSELANFIGSSRVGGKPHSPVLVVAAKNAAPAGAGANA